MIGESVPRLEDPPLLTGRGRFVADLSRDGQLHMRVVRSSVAHGRLRQVDASALRGVSGVVAVFTAEDLPAGFPPIAMRQVGFDDMVPYLQPVLASERVRYVGEPVAIVLATDEYLAEDAADLVRVEIEELPVHLDPVSSPTEWDDAGNDTEALRLGEEYGEVDSAFQDCRTVVELELRVGRHSGVPMETRGTLAYVDATTGVLMVEGAAKVPHYNRSALASMLGIAPGRIELHEGHVGGGFGVRGEIYPEDVLTAWAALRTGRPVKWIEDRREHLMAANHSRDQVHRIRAAVDGSGYILAIDDEFWLDQGAYVRTHGATVPTLTATLLPGPYRVPSYRVAGHVRLTNKTPAGTYRAPGRYEATFVRERLLDAIADRLRLDPAEVRRVNLINTSEMPFRRPMSVLGAEVEYDSGDYLKMLDRVLDHVGYPELVADLGRRRSHGELVGLGLGFFVEKSGLGPYEGVQTAIDADGSLRIITGAASVGQGVETTIAQIAADVMNMDYRQIRVSHGQTNELDYGYGAFASRLTVMAGSATHRAALQLRDKAISVAADLMEAAEEDLEIVDGSVQVRGTPARSMSLGEIAVALEPTGALKLGLDPGLGAEAWFGATHMTYPYGLHLAVVRIDPDTGGVKVLRYVVAYDVGRAVNPMMIEGQICGGAAQGVGGALLENFDYDEQGQPQSVSFMEYLLPTIQEMPQVEMLLSEDAPSPLNPLGVKGAGEGGTTGVGAAIAGAVDNALAQPGAVASLPISPSFLRALMRTKDLATSSSATSV